MFKVGDKVVRKKEWIDPVYSDDGYDGRVLTVIEHNGFTVFFSFEGGKGKSSGDAYKFELYKERSALIDNQGWYISIKDMSQEHRSLITEWLHEQGMIWISNIPRNYVIAESCQNIFLSEGNKICTGGSVYNKKEIKFYFKAVIGTVEIPEFPPKETEAQKKMKELEDKQREIAEELAKLRESM